MVEHGRYGMGWDGMVECLLVTSKPSSLHDYTGVIWGNDTWCVEQVAVIVAALKPATVTLCLDTNGNHVVQRLLQHLAPTDNEFVFEVGKLIG